jgi:hypothetical protein
VSFRPLSSVFWRAAIAGMACLAFAWASRGGEGTRSIEIVPFSGAAMDTNFEQSAQDDLQTFKAWEPTAPHPYKSPATTSANSRVAPLMPRPQQPVLSREQQELLDRRRNWVFMTPEDYASPTGKEEKDPAKPESDQEKNMTAMERYFQRLNASQQAAVTNQSGKMNGDRLGGSDNLLNNPSRNTESMFGQSPFAANPQAGVFQSPQNGDLRNVFDSDNGQKMPSPEEVRVQAEQKTHMDSFKQLWNIDQAPTATPVTTPASGPIDSAPLFGVSAPAVSSPFNAANSVMPGNSSSTPPPTTRPVIAPRVSAPPHSDFTAPQRPF